MEILHTETGGTPKKPIELQLVVNTEDIDKEIKRYEEEYENGKADPTEDKLGSYMNSENGDEKSAEQALEDMKDDLDNLKNLSRGLLKKSEVEDALDAIRQEIYGIDNKVDWSKYFAQIPKRKSDGAFAIGRVVQIYAAHGFSWEDSEAYGRRGPEMIIKSISENTAELQIRSGIIEKW